MFTDSPKIKLYNLLKETGSTIVMIKIKNGVGACYNNSGDNCRDEINKKRKRIF